MTITTEQARKEITRREAMAEIERRKGLESKPEGIVAEPVDWKGDFYPDLDLTRPADRKILEYRRINEEGLAEQDRIAKLDWRLKGVEARMRAKRIESSLEQASPYDFGPGAYKPVAGKISAMGNIPSETRRQAVQDVGGMLGGMATGKPPVPGAAPTPYSKIGAGLGGAIGEAGYQIGQQLTGSPERPQDWKEAGKRILKAGGRQFAEEGISNVASGLISPGGKIPKERQATIKWMRERGINPTLGQATGSKGAIGILENIVESSFTGGPGMAAHHAVNEKLLSSYGDDIVKSLGGMSKIDAGRVIQQVITDKATARKAIAKPIYEEAKRISRNKLIKANPLKSALLKIQKEVLVEGMPSLNPTGLGRIVEQGLELGDNITYEEYNKIVKALGDLAYPQSEAGKIFGTNASRVLKEAHHEIKGALLNPQNGLPQMAIDLTKKGDFLTSDAHAVWDTDLIKKIVKKYPEHVTNTIFKKSGGEISQVGEIVRAGRLFESMPSGTKKALQGAFVQDLITNEGLSKMAGEQVLDGTKILDIVNNKQGREVLEQFMPAKNIDEIIDFADALRVHREKPIALGGGMTIKILQAGALLGLFQAAIPGDSSATDKAIGGGAGMVLLGPKAIEVLFTNDVLVRQFTNTLLQEGGPKQVTRLLTRLLSNKALKKAIGEDRQDRERAAKAEQERYKTNPRELGGSGGRGY
ncbi:MAG: hypothetical protein MUO31_06940 [Thermodesulfovibrionales bacterium]|nr:hypothetical protein [Thermodesulfovibrionales bacterium]